MSRRRWLALLLIGVAVVAAAVLTYRQVSAPAARLLVGIASAFPAESRAVAGALSAVETVEHGGLLYLRGRIGETDVVLFVTGAGMVNAASRVQHAIDYLPLTHLIFSGIAGGLDPALTPGIVVAPAVWVNHQHHTIGSGGRAALAPDLPPPALTAVANAGGFPADVELLDLARESGGVDVGGVGASGDAFVADEAFRAGLLGAFEARIVDMESAAAAQVALLNGVPFLAVRAVSDGAGAAAQAEIEANVRTASDAAARVVVAIVGRLR